MTEDDVAGSAAAFYADRYGGDAEGIWHAPGRVNLIGEHTDYNDGFALPFALGTGVCVAAGRREDDRLGLASRQQGDAVTTVSLTGLAAGAAGGWAAYPAGVAWAMASAGHRLTGMNLAVDADLALGTGLSSSAALECAAGLAMADMCGLRLSRTDLAALGRRAENDFVGAPTGVMDQLAVLLCERDHGLLLDCRSGSGVSVPLPLAAAGLALLVIDTRVQHELSDGGYGARRLACENAARTLGVPALRDVTDIGELGALGDPVVRRRARHVVTENHRVIDVAELLRADKIAAIGPLLTASHVSLRDDFEVSWPEADVAVGTALGAGALGARMTGGGFGGSVIALAPRDAAAAVADAVLAEFGRRGWPRPAVTSVAPAQGARRLR
jgi:galactokinase